MFGRPDHTYNDIREKSLMQWLDEMEQQLVKDIPKKDLDVFDDVMHKMIENLKEENYA